VDTESYDERLLFLSAKVEDRPTPPIEAKSTTQRCESNNQLVFRLQILLYFPEFQKFFSFAAHLS